MGPVLPQLKSLRSASAGGRPVFLRVSTKEKILFAQNLAIMSKSGMSLLDSLRLIEAQTKSRGFQYILRSIEVEIDNGQYLSAAIGKYASVFDEIFINIIRVGEASGTLSENLHFLAQELAKKDAIRRKVKTAMIYPTIVFIATIGVVWLLTGVVLPKILPIFSEMSLELPATTKVLIAVSDFIAHNNLYIFITLVGGAIALRMLMKLAAFRYLFDKFLLYVPVVRSFVVQVNMAYFTRTFAILLKSGVKIVEALTITSSSLQNLVYRRALRNIANSLSGGDTISKHLKANEHLFPTTLARLIEVGENTGNLDDNLQYLSEYYDGEVSEMTTNITSIVEPLILVVMGLMVGFIALSIITPLFQLSTGGL
jgi:type IV pilus assembly protein PilC